MNYNDTAIAQAAQLALESPLQREQRRILVNASKRAAALANGELRDQAAKLTSSITDTGLSITGRQVALLRAGQAGQVAELVEQRIEQLEHSADALQQPRASKQRSSAVELLDDAADSVTGGNDNSQMPELHVSNSLDPQREAKLASRKIKPRYMEIARLSAIGLGNSAIAEQTGYCIATVLQVQKHPAVKQAIMAFNEQRNSDMHSVKQRIDGLQGKALETLERLLGKDAPPSVQLSAARDLLDRGGNAAPKQVQVQSVSTRLSMDELMELKQRAGLAGGAEEDV